MRVVTRREIIRQVPAEFKRRYNHQRDEKRWGRNSHTTWGEVIDGLDKLDSETCAPEEINKLIGNDSWTDNKCDECGAQSETLVRLGEEPDYEARWQDLCGSCLLEASKLAGKP